MMQFRDEIRATKKFRRCAVEGNDISYTFQLLICVFKNHLLKFDSLRLKIYDLPIKICFIKRFRKVLRSPYAMGMLVGQSWWDSHVR